MLQCYAACCPTDPQQIETEEYKLQENKPNLCFYIGRTKTSYCAK